MRAILRFVLFLTILPLTGCMDGASVTMRTDQIAYTGIDEYAQSPDSRYVCRPIVRVRIRGGGITGPSDSPDIEWSGGYIEYRDASGTVLARREFFDSDTPGQNLPWPESDEWRDAQLELSADRATFDWTLVAHYSDLHSYSGDSKTASVSGTCRPAG